MSGLAVTPAGPVVVNDSGNATVVYTLRPDCSVASARPVGVRGRDVEDLARGADGTLWLADVGDNDRERSTVALIRVPRSGTGTVVRLAYPDGPHDAEALLLPADGRPVIVTKEGGGFGRVYTTDRPLPDASAEPLALRAAGEVRLPSSTTEGGPVSFLGRGLITGGALAEDGRTAALRTYTDAWLFPVGGPTADDVIAGLQGTPTPVPLPGEPQGEALAFGADGSLLSAGESPDGAPTARLYGFPVPPVSTSPAPRAQVGAPPDGSGDRRGTVIAAVALGALAVVVGGLLLARRRRRRP
ncbi:hypothetical protein GCM10023201_13300 [Actinomycetospora corticicola]|uniref:Esterase-like activity of phytase family protein n=1 Tax=Actinomycetospora corticicola TaxID=663602 RepID=A0A7Y9J699_9PSEU|nr:hypothetical protein [Actinomycetospora corticicola]NYD36309.1 hypothetical protein [Actinomycetospora corticicola]